jgi:hypothetical protein
MDANKVQANACQALVFKKMIIIWKL